MPKNYFQNHEAFWEGVGIVERIHGWADTVQKELGKNPEIKYDHRDLYTLAMLTIDLSGVPEAEQESYFKAEYRKIHDAFDTPDPNNPERSHPDLVKPYIKKMFDCLNPPDLSRVDYNDPKQIQQIITTMLITQMLAIKVKEYPEQATELFPTHEDKRRIDALSAKAYAMQLEARNEMSYAGLDSIGDHFSTIGRAKQQSHSQMVQANLINKVFDSTLEGSDLVTLDPAADDLTTKFFMGEEFTAIQDAGHGPEEFNKDLYGRAMIDQLGEAMMYTSFEYQIGKPALENSDTYDKSDVLIINGKPLSTILREYNAEYGVPGKFYMAGQFLREALLKGEPVTLISTSFDNEGGYKFQNKDIRLDLDKLDLDKLNAKDRYENYNIIRRALDTIGLWRIPKKYPSNKERDEMRAKLQAAGNSAHEDAVKAVEEDMISSYNSLSRRGTIEGCRRVIPKLTRVEVEPSQSKEPVRENIDFGPTFEKEKITNVEPQKSIDDKVITNEPKVK